MAASEPWTENDAENLAHLIWYLKDWRGIVDRNTLSFKTCPFDSGYIDTLRRARMLLRNRIGGRASARER